MRTLALETIPAGLVKIDKVWVATAFLFAAMAIFLPRQFMASLGFTGESLLSIAPYLAGSVMLAAGLRAANADSMIANVFQGRAGWMILTAAVFGALSPFCSCGVVPLVAALLAMGVPLAPVMAFWVSSPIMDPAMFLLTAAGLGTGFAAAKTIAAIAIGLFAGFGTYALQGLGVWTSPLKEGAGNGGCDGGTVRKPSDVRWRIWEDASQRSQFWRGTRDSGLFLTKWMVLAFVLESLMVAYIPPELLVPWLGGGGFQSIALGAFIGVPAYLNGYAAIPLVAGLMESGMSPGAGMAFMIGGAVTCIPAAVAVYALVRKPVFVGYLVFALFGSILSGIIYQMVL